MKKLLLVSLIIGLPFSLKSYQEPAWFTTVKEKYEKTDLKGLLSQQYEVAKQMVFDKKATGTEALPRVDVPDFNGTAKKIDDGTIMTLEYSAGVIWGMLPIAGAVAMHNQNKRSPFLGTFVTRTERISHQDINAAAIAGNITGLCAGNYMLGNIGENPNKYLSEKSSLSRMLMKAGAKSRLPRFAMLFLYTPTVGTVLERVLHG